MTKLTKTRSFICEKCESSDISLTYIGPDRVFSILFGWQDQSEMLNCDCKRCGYCWNEPPSDLLRDQNDAIERLK